MKLLCLTIEGITSIRKPITIDFEKHLNGYDLFAITGATGSGKSSILTSISLALYGKTHKKLPIESFISLNHDKARIELDFQVHFKKYKSIWTSKLIRSKSGKVRLETKKLLYDQTGNAIETQPADIIGLDHEQFFKTVIINQGQFAEFLTSTFSNRKAIIEQLYGTKEIGLILPLLRKKIAELENDSKVLCAKLENGTNYNEQEIQFLQNQIDQRDIGIKNNTSLIENLKKMLDPLKVMSESKLKYNQYLGRIELLKEDLIKKDKLYKNKLSDFNQSEENYKSLKNSFDKRKDAIRETIRLNDENNYLKQNCLQIINEIDDIKFRDNKLQIETNKTLEEIALIKEKIIRSKIKIKNISDEQIRDVRKKIHTLDTEEYEANHLIKSKNTLLNELEKNQIKKTEITKKLKPNDKYNEKLHQFNEKKKNLQEFKIKVLEEKNDSIGLFQKTEDILMNMRELSEIIQKNNDSFFLKKNELSEIIHDISIQKENYAEKLLKFAVETCKHHNSTSDNCIVCDGRITQKETTLNTLTPPKDIDLKLSQLLERKNKLEYDISILEDEIQSNKINKTKNEKEYKLLLTKITNDIEITENLENKFSKEEIHHFYEQKLATIENSILSIEQSYKETLIQQQENLNNQKLLDTINDTHRELNQNIDLLNKSIDEKNVTISILNKKIKDILQHELEINDSSIRSMLLGVLDLIESKEKHNDSLKGQKQLIAENLTNLKKKEDLLSNNKLQLAKNLSEIQSLFPEISQISPKQFLKNMESDIEKKLTQKDLLYKELNNHKQLKSNLIQQINLLEENLNTLDLLIMQYSKDIHQSASNIDIIEIKNEFSNLASFIEQIKLSSNIEIIDQGLIDLLLDSLKESIQKLQNKNSEFIIEKSKNEAIISEYIKNQKTKANVKESLEQLTQQLNKLKDLRDVLGNDAFSKFALAIIEQNLIDHTNKELESLCEGRYKLMEKEVSKRDGPEFFVIDYWNGGSVRKIGTLSGGETFLISLAMALSLAELSRGKTEIDTFIIDEGFGTLDEESIEDVIETLNTIRNRGKQIGLISHVKKLTQRIPVNLEMQKNNDGYSNISVIFN